MEQSWEGSKPRLDPATSAELLADHSHLGGLPCQPLCAFLRLSNAANTAGGPASGLLPALGTLATSRHPLVRQALLPVPKPLGLPGR